MSTKQRFMYWFYDRLWTYGYHHDNSHLMYVCALGMLKYHAHEVSKEAC